MTIIPRFSTDFKLPYLNNNFTSKQIVFSHLFEVFRKVLNIKSSISKNSDIASNIKIQRISNKYGLSESFDMNQVERCKKILLRAFYHDISTASLSKKNDPFLPLLEKSYLSTLIQQHFEPGFCISLPRNLFLYISDFRDLKDTILLRPHADDEMLQIIVNKNPNSYSHCLIEFRDPESEDLDRCNRVFAKMVFHYDSTSELEEIVTPSFSFTDAINVILQMKKLLNSSTLFYINESTKTPCDSECKDNALISLKATQILEGCLWYENKGAEVTNNISRLFFKQRLEDEYVKAFEVKNSYGSALPLEYDKFAKDFTLRQEMKLITPEAYEAAKNYLSTLTIDEISDFLENLPKSPRIDIVLDAFNKALDVVNDGDSDIPKTIEELYYNLSIVGEHCTKSISHEIYHLFRDCFAQHRHSMYLTYAYDEIRKGTTSQLVVAIFTQVLGEIPMLNLSSYISGLEWQINYIQSISNGPSPQLTNMQNQLSSLKIGSLRPSHFLVYDLMMGDNLVTKFYFDLYGQYSNSKTYAHFSNATKNQTINETKIISNSTEMQRAYWHQYNYDRGMDNYMFPLIAAIYWLQSLTVEQFSQINPAFFEHNKQNFPDSIKEILLNNRSISIREFIFKLEQSSSKQFTIDFIGDLLLSLKKPFSDSVVNIIENCTKNPELFEPKQKYIIWKLAKLTAGENLIYGFE